MPYTRALSTLGCPELSLEAAMALATRHGVEAIEIRALGGCTDLPAYLAATYGNPATLRREAATAGVRVCGLSTSLKAVGATPADREAFLQFVPWAEALDVPWLRVFDGGRAGDAAELAAAAETVAWWRELRARHGWRTDLMIETHDSLLTGAQIRHLIDALVPRVAIRWDSHHTWKKGVEDPLITWRTIKDAVVSVDVKDSVSRPSAKHAWSYVLPGAGEFPMAALREVLRSEYAGPLSLEWEKLWHPYLPSLDEALTQANRTGWW